MHAQFIKTIRVNFSWPLFRIHKHPVYYFVVTTYNIKWCNEVLNEAMPIQTYNFRNQKHMLHIIKRVISPYSVRQQVETVLRELWVDFGSKELEYNTTNGFYVHLHNSPQIQTSDGTSLQAAFMMIENPEIKEVVWRPEDQEIEKTEDYSEFPNITEFLRARIQEITEYLGLHKDCAQEIPLMHALMIFTNHDSHSSSSENNSLTQVSLPKVWKVPRYHKTTLWSTDYIKLEPVKPFYLKVSKTFCDSVRIMMGARKITPEIQAIEPGKIIWYSGEREIHEDTFLTIDTLKQKIQEGYPTSSATARFWFSCNNSSAGWQAIFHRLVELDTDHTVSLVQQHDAATS